MTIRILLVDDQEMVRRGFAMVLDTDPDLSVVGEAEDGDTAVAFARDNMVDVVVMDVRMSRMDGVEATRLIRAEANAPKVLILTTFDLDEYVYDALRAGANGFLLKDAGTAELTSAIRHVHAGDAVVAPSATRRLLERFSVPASPTDQSQNPAAEAAQAGTTALPVLTPREVEVVRLVARGLSNSEIAEEFVLTEGTVKTHISNILTKLGLRDRVQIVVTAFTSGMVRADNR
ncbi:response regulator [Brevibacterium zhoupengii]|uniref:response regulator n=1 Tax=Brevibacterium zhoupengii TaxID=2898795 RepID=UPI001E2AB185|nr:response regulator transcription factor [Brevibacterium zhoupengii]